MQQTQLLCAPSFPYMRSIATDLAIILAQLCYRASYAPVSFVDLHSMGTFSVAALEKMYHHRRHHHNRQPCYRCRPRHRPHHHHYRHQHHQSKNHCHRQCQRAKHVLTTARTKSLLASTSLDLPSPAANSMYIKISHRQPRYPGTQAQVPRLPSPASNSLYIRSSHRQPRYPAIQAQVPRLPSPVPNGLYIRISCCRLEKHSLSTGASREAPVDNKRGTQISQPSFQ